MALRRWPIKPMAQPVDGHLFTENSRLSRWLWRHLIGGTVRNLSSWPLDPVVDDLSRFPKGFGRARKRHRCRQPQPILIVDRNNEAGLASEIETMEMVSLRLEDHGLHSHAALDAASSQLAASGGRKDKLPRVHPNLAARPRRDDRRLCIAGMGRRMSLARRPRVCLRLMSSNDYSYGRDTRRRECARRSRACCRKSLA